VRGSYSNATVILLSSCCHPCSPWTLILAAADGVAARIISSCKGNSGKFREIKGKKGNDFVLFTARLQGLRSGVLLPGTHHPLAARIITSGKFR